MIAKSAKITEQSIGEFKFYISPFGAWTAQRVMFQVKSALVKSFGGSVERMGGLAKEKNILDASLFPIIFQILRDLDGDVAEGLIKTLLVEHKNISFEPIDSPGSREPLDFSATDTIFCGDLQNMYALAAWVIMVNYESFFDRKASPFGDLARSFKSRMKGQA